MKFRHCRRGLGRLGSAFTVAAVAILGLTAGPQASWGADASAGKQVFKKCITCHKLEAGKNGVGPSLHGIVGRKAGTAPGYRYSKAMKEADFVWTRERLDEWLINPRKMIAGTKMPFAGLPSQEDRDNVIEYLAQSAK